jgi:hypothetical protein
MMTKDVLGSRVVTASIIELSRLWSQNVKVTKRTVSQLMKRSYTSTGLQTGFSEQQVAVTV